MTIECDSKGVKSTFQFKNSVTVAEVIGTFVKKTQAGNVGDFSLYHTNEQGDELPMENLYPLGFYKLKNLVPLLLASLLLTINLTSSSPLHSSFFFLGHNRAN